MDQAPITTLGPSTSIVGDLRSDEDVRVEGAVDGNITTSGDLLVGPNAEVTGDLQGRVVRVEGRVTGNVRATGVLEIGGQGQLVGDIVAGALRIEDGGGFHGQVAIESDEDDADSATVADDDRLEPVADVGGLHIPPPSRSVLHADLDDIPPAWDTEEHLAADTSAGMREAFDEPIPLTAADLPLSPEEPPMLEAFPGDHEVAPDEEPYRLRNPASILLGDSEDDISEELDEDLAPPQRSIDQLHIHEDEPRPGLRPPPSRRPKR